MLKIGLKASPGCYSPSELVELTASADTAGFDLMDASEHFSPLGAEQHAMPMWAWMGAAAARTKRILLGMAVSFDMLKADPLGVAQAAQALRMISLGRSYLSVGTGECDGKYRMEDSEPDGYEREDLLIEALGLIRRLWTGQPVTHAGTHFQALHAQLNSGCDEIVPVHFPSLLPGSAQFAGFYGDGLLAEGGKTPYFYRRLLHEFENGARKAGKDPARMTRAIELRVHYPAGGRGKLGSVRVYSPDTEPLVRKNDKRFLNSTSAGDPADLEAGVDFTSADPAEQARNLQQYIDLGFNTLLVTSSALDKHGFIQRYGAEVLPLARKHNHESDFMRLRVYGSESR